MRKRTMVGAIAAGVAAVSAFAAWLILDPSALATLAFFLANLTCGMCHVAL